MDNPKKTPNRLIHEKSPYLIQHAYNPVDWHPWGNEAFAKAKSENKPVFLSIGYSTCHWCHVMEEESFEDPAVAALLNRSFVPIKVDREERPDIDAVYMAVCQAVTGAGGWPLTIVMTPEQKPFFAATYLPKTSRFGRFGMLELLPELIQQWQTNRAALLESGDKISVFLQAQAEPAEPASDPSDTLLHHAVALFHHLFDRQYGGFGSAPKFPTPHNLLFLLRYGALEQNSAVVYMAEKTLDQLYKGGIFDHIGGGFSRYSTDEKWLVPHFEKMLYDNALLSYAYLEGYQITGQPLYQDVARKTLNYVLRELTHPEGGFYCSQDADSDGVEGKYYTFTPEEIQSVLGPEAGDRFCRWYGVIETGHLGGKSIPNLLHHPNADLPDPEMERLAQALYAYRLQRVPLHKDDKVLTAWNGLMIAAFAKAARTLEEPRYLQAAQQARQFVKDHLTDAKGRLLVRWREGEAAHAGQLSDYAFYAWALLELYESTFDVNYLQEADQIAKQIIDGFLDEKDGGFYLYAHDGEQLISRPKELYDGAMPSGNAVTALVLERLAQLTGAAAWRSRSDEQLSYLAGQMDAYPAGHSFALLAMMAWLYPSQELICATRQVDTPHQIQRMRNEGYHPHLTVLIKTPENESNLADVAPFTAHYPIPVRAAYYLCQNKICEAPVYDLKSLIEKLAPKETGA